MSGRVLKFTNPVLAIIGAVLAGLLWLISSQLAPISRALERHAADPEIHVPRATIAADDREQERRTAANAERLARVEAKVDAALAGISEIKRAVREID